jgi:anti-sigma factor RsiW
MGEVRRHPEDALQDALDGCLDAGALAELEAHLSGCATCRELRKHLRQVKGALGAMPPPPPPEALPAALRQTLDRADRRSATVRWGAAAAALAAVLALLVWLFPRPGPAPSLVAQDYRALLDGRLALALETTDVARMEAFFAGQGLGFETRVFDLAMMQYRLAGGSVHEAKGRRSALFVYGGPGGHLLLCQMYLGHTSELPRADEVREKGGIRFHVFRRDQVTLVFWQEGDVVCVLAGDGSPETVTQLAYAKAVKL